MEPPVAAAEVGIYHRMVAPVLVELLAEHGIRATEADQPSGVFRTGHPEQSMVLVPREQLDEARRIAETELPQRLRNIEDAAAHDPDFSDTEEERTSDEPLTGWWPAPDEETDEEDDVEWYDADPLGYMEPAVARVFIELCEKEDIGADTEYPLDEPPPVYARADGRVRVHVERGYAEEAKRIIDVDLVEELARRGVTPTEPLIDETEV